MRYFIESNIMRKGQPATAGAKILEGFTSPINATVIERLEKCGHEIAGTASMNAFGIVDFLNPAEPMPQAISVIAKGTADFCLCNDFFGQYRKRVAESKCCYIKPTYGTVSRYGLIPSATSMDQIGVLCRDMKEGFTILSSIAGKDEKDGAMYPDAQYKYSKQNKPLTIGVPRAIIDKMDSKAKENITNFANNFETVEITLEHFNVYATVLQILSNAEISHNINRYDGIKYGRRASGYKNLNELYIKTRTEGFNRETKFTALMGAMVLSSENYEKYYEKAMKIRRLIKESVTFAHYDIIVLPCEISDDPFDNLALYALASLIGIPSISFNYQGKGLQLLANVKNESALLSAWEECQA